MCSLRCSGLTQQTSPSKFCTFYVLIFRIATITLDYYKLHATFCLSSYYRKHKKIVLLSAYEVLTYVSRTLVIKTSYAPSELMSITFVHSILI